MTEQPNHDAALKQLRAMYDEWDQSEHEARQIADARKKDMDEYCAHADKIFKDADASFSKAQSIGTQMVREFAQAALDRFEAEQKWLKDLRQFKGKYDPEEEARLGPNRSKVFVKKTRAKVKTMNARVFDLIFPAGKDQNFDLGPTPRATVSDQKRKEIVDLLEIAFDGEKPDDNKIDEAIRDVVALAAKNMSAEVADQLVECSYRGVAKQVIHSGDLYGIGILKGPLVERRIRERYIEQSGKWTIKTEEYTIPFVDFVPVWRWYPDMQATELENCRFVYERHLMTRSAFRKLSRHKSFNKRAILDYIKSNPKGRVEFRYHDNELRSIGDRDATNIADSGMYEVLERWGWFDADELREAGVKIPRDREDEEFFCNSWCLPDGTLLRAVIQPINGVTWPYHLYYFDKDESNIFGDGIASVMRDDQKMINAVVRMILDNGAHAAGPMLEVFPSLLAKTDKMTEFFPWRVWLRNMERPDVQAVRPIELPMQLEELTALYGLFDQQGDEATIVPKYSSGENPTRGAASTASGLSMLMSAQGVTVKDLVVNYDEGVAKSFLKALYRWNMQFNPKQDIKGDFDVTPMAAASMMAKEVRSQQLDTFGASITPADEPYIKRLELLQQRAEAHELVDVVKTKEEAEADADSPAAKAQAELAEAQAQLSMALLKAQVAELEAKVAKLTADTNKTNADTINTRVSAAYSAMQAGSVAAQSPGTAAAGDELLRASGWQDATAPEVNGKPAAPVPAAPPGQALAPLPDATGPDVGMQRGMETADTADNLQ